MLKCIKCEKSMNPHRAGKGETMCLTCDELRQLMEAIEVTMSARSRVGTQITIEWKVMLE